MLIKIVFMSFFLTSCLTNNKDTSNSTESPISSTPTAIKTPIGSGPKILAKNIILSNTRTDDSDSSVDTSTKIPAKNVVIKESTGRIESLNLDDALKDEIAVDLQRTLTNSIWNVKNIITTGESNPLSFKNGSTGEISFSEDEITISSGVFGAGGMIYNLSNTNCDNAQEVTVKYTVMGENMIIIKTKLIDYLGNQSSSMDLIHVSIKNTNELVFAMKGRGACAIYDYLKVSTLTRSNE